MDGRLNRRKKATSFKIVQRAVNRALKLNHGLGFFSENGLFTEVSLESGYSSVTGFEFC